MPHGWFTHFYVVGVLWNAVALFHSLIECAWAGSDPSVVGAALASTLFQAHVTRRLYESGLCVHPQTGRAHARRGVPDRRRLLHLRPLTLGAPVRGGRRRGIRRRRVAPRVHRVPARTDRRDQLLPDAAADGARHVLKFAFTASGRSGVGALMSGFCVAGGVYAWWVGNAHQHRYHVALAELRGGEKRRENVEREGARGRREARGPFLFRAPRGLVRARVVPALRRGGVAVRGDLRGGVRVRVRRGGIATGITGFGPAAAAARTTPMLASVGANLSLAARRNHEWYLRHMPDSSQGQVGDIPGIL